MSLIKSALEIAMQRAQSLQADTEGLHRSELYKEGARLAAKALEDISLDIQKNLEKFNPQDRPHVQEGMIKTLLSHIVLPQNSSQLQALETVNILLSSLNKSCNAVMNQLYEFAQDYLTRKEEIKKQLDAHFLPILKKREAQIAEKTGRRVRLTPESIPEIHSAYKEQLHAFEEHYRSGVEQLRWKLSQLLLPHHD